MSSHMDTKHPMNSVHFLLSIHIEHQANWSKEINNLKHCSPHFDNKLTAQDVNMVHLGDSSLLRIPLTMLYQVHGVELNVVNILIT